MKPLTSGKSRVYDLLHKGTVTALIAVAAYGLFEVGRGSYYIMNSNRAARAVRRGRACTHAWTWWREGNQGLCPQRVGGTRAPFLHT